MPRSSAPTRQTILDAAYGLFRRRGFVRVSMDEIAASAAVTKRTLYYHFASKDLLLAQVLEAQHALALAAFRTFGESLAGSPESIIDQLFKDLAVWSDSPRWAGSGFTRLVIELADLRGHPARLIARRHKAMLEAHLADLLASVDATSPRQLAREIWLLSEGAISLILIHGDRSYAAAAAEAAKKLIRSECAQKKYPARGEAAARRQRSEPVGIKRRR
ncbi:TetR/AcrR family transcriptional regulator [Bradyrhizobium sp. AUGA SZCCT0431]|uniref:TetR/AcrR family transcriptional regulator n=1 Tax=Bradyrhizobium sp. AUGA SZCCT0431 TaxID=2807674 RepID=UPI001BAD30EE|nr:TetR/AcrR family transcriptional regulator [Bradyrhizobium sp. AUGA SZCCT0431]MBR1146263.1 TetR/AcrR family transcriptional regulator [Bradyrhizobium sp. AUGA SZCCT0431]